jgi:hypothetical protein
VQYNKPHASAIQKSISNKATSNKTTTKKQAAPKQSQNKQNKTNKICLNGFRLETLSLKAKINETPIQTTKRMKKDKRVAKATKNKVVLIKNIL